MNGFRAVKSFPMETFSLSEDPSSCKILRRSDVEKDVETIGSYVLLIGDKVICLSLAQASIYLYNTRSNEYITRLEYSKSLATCFGTIASFDNIAVVGYENGDILLWNLDNPSVYLCKLVDIGKRAHQSRICCLRSTLKECPRIISLSSDGIIKVWNLSRFSCDCKNLRSSMVLEKTFPAHPSKVCCFDMSRDGNQLVTGSNDGSVRVWDMKDLKECCLLLGHIAPVTAVSFYLSSSSSFVISGGADETIRLWNCSSGDCVLLLSSLMIPRGFIFIENNLLFAYSNSSLGFVWNLSYGQCLAQVTLHEKDNGNTTSLNIQTSTWDNIGLDYHEYQVFIPALDGSILIWNCYSLVQKWKEFVPLKELFEVGIDWKETQTPKMTGSSRAELENPIQTKDSSPPYEQSDIYNIQNVLRLREQRLCAEKQSICQQRRELELWAKNLEESKKALEDLYNYRVENLENKAKILNDLYREISWSRCSNALTIHNIIHKEN